MNTTLEAIGTRKDELKTTYCNIDKLFYIYLDGEEIHYQKEKPTNEDLMNAYLSDQWDLRFLDMKNKECVRVSQRIFYSMLGAVPPKKFTGSSFYCGECYSGNLYYYFEKENNICYGELKPII